MFPKAEMTPTLKRNKAYLIQIYLKIIWIYPKTIQIYLITITIYKPTKPVPFPKYSNSKYYPEIMKLVRLKAILE